MNILLIYLFEESVEPADRLIQFAAERYIVDPASRVFFKGFFEEFIDWLPPEERGNWSKIRISRELPFASKNGRGNKKLILGLKHRQR